MKVLRLFAAIVVAFAASSTPSLASKVLFSPYFTNVAANVKGGQIVVSWSLRSYYYKMQVHLTRTPAFDPSFEPAGYALLLPPVLSSPGYTDESFTDSNVKEGVTYSYALCAFWIEAVYGNGPTQPATSHVNQTACASPVTARLGYTPVRLHQLQISQPSNVHAVRQNASTVALSWSTTTGSDTAHLYLMANTAASMPPSDWTAPGWGKDAAVSPVAPQKYNLPINAAPTGKHNYYMVCAASSDDKAVLCSAPVQETGLPFAPAPMLSH